MKSLKPEVFQIKMANISQSQTNQSLFVWFFGLCFFKVLTEQNKILANITNRLWEILGSILDDENHR